MGLENARPFLIGAWRSLVARLFWVQEVVGSDPAAPTNEGLASNLKTLVLFLAMMFNRPKAPSKARLCFQIRSHGFL